MLKVALVGNPNSGKSTLFNLLTGLNQNTGNFPGVTVDKKTGTTIIQAPGSETTEVTLIDLPGIYSLNAKSIDEQVACEVIKNKSNEDHPDIIIVVVDSTNLKRGLFLATQVIELEIPVIVALNMADLASKQGIEIDTELLSEKLGTRVIEISARKNKGIDLLKSAVIAPLILSKKSIVTEKLVNQAQATIERYRVITQILDQCLKTKENPQQFTVRLDKILTHKIWGYVIFLAVLFLIFQSVFYFSSYPMQWIEGLFITVSEWGNATLPKGEFSELVINGVLAGLSGVVVFIPQIAMLFGFIAILEDTGYMARVSFIMDRLMRKFGLNGKSVIPLISGVACAVPAIMSTRTIGNWKERMITIMVIPLMSCSARLPVYTLLISLIIPEEKKWFLFNAQGFVLMAMYLIGFIAAISAAWMMKYILKSKERSYFIMEMPIYRSPRWSSVALTMLDKVKVFLFDTGKIIIAISIVLWVLSSHGPGNRFEEIEKKYYLIPQGERLTPSSGEIEGVIASEKLEASYAGIIGKTIEPLIRPLGFDWKIGIALITSFAAREVFVGTMATIYSVGDPNNTLTIREKMMLEKNPETGEKVFSLAVGFSLMVFYAFAMQCVSTLAVVYSETKKWKWPVIQFVYMGGLAYLASLLVYQVLK